MAAAIGVTVSISIRPERPEDQASIRRVNEKAFGQPAEADLVHRLRVCADRLSLVAEDDGGVVGHILFTPVVVDGHAIVGMGLAPLAVLPDRQRLGIGSQLVAEGLRLLRDRRCPFVVVVGDSEYYPRFGFEPASRHGLHSQWPGMPDAAFMVSILEPSMIAGISGIARYRSEFDDVA